MFSQRNWILWALVLLTGCYLPCKAADIDAAIRAEDRRLEKPVTITQRRLCLGDLLEQLSRQTGIPILINERNPASGIRLTIGCTQMPAADCLNALWRLLSNREAEWSWMRSGKPDAFAYELVPPPRPAESADRLRHYAQMALENYVDLMIHFAYLSPEERLRNKHKISEALNQDNDTFADDLVSQTNMWDYVRLFAEAVPPELRLQVVRGQQEARIPVNDLTPDSQELLHAVWKHFDLRTDGQPEPEPTVLHFYAKALITVRPEVAPTVWLDLGEGNGSVSVLGGRVLEEGIRAAIRKLWMFTGDSTSSSASQRRVAAVKDTPPRYEHEYMPFVMPDGTLAPQPIPYVVDWRLSQLARGASMTVLALFPGDQDRDPGAPGGHSAQDFLDRLQRNSLHPITKWHKDVLFVTYPAWFIEDTEDHAVPYALVKRCLRGQDGLLTLSNLVALFSAIDMEQVRYLAQDYHIIPAASGLFPVCALYARAPEIVSAEGMRLDVETIAALRLSPPFNRCSAFIDGTATALRLSETDSRTEGQRKLSIRAEVQDTSGRWSPLCEFLQSAPLAQNASQSPGS